MKRTTAAGCGFESGIFFAVGISFAGVEFLISFRKRFFLLPLISFFRSQASEIINWPRYAAVTTPILHPHHGILSSAVVPWNPIRLLIRRHVFRVRSAKYEKINLLKTNVPSLIPPLHFFSASPLPDSAEIIDRVHYARAVHRYLHTRAVPYLFLVS